MVTCEPRCVLTLGKWHFGGENLSLAYNIIPIEAANMHVGNTGSFGGSEDTTKYEPKEEMLE